MGFISRAVRHAAYQQRRTVYQKRRSEYHSYLASPQWQAKRNQYRSSDRPQRCVSCGKAWGPGMHLHHLTYQRVGRERLTDLVAMCDGCHTEVHQLNRRIHDLRRSTNTVIRRHRRERRRRVA